eukprot:c25747_g1_i3 orf=143-2287(+)
MSSCSPRSVELQDLVDDADYAASQNMNVSSSGIASSKEWQHGYDGRRGDKGFGTTEGSEVVFIKDNVSVHPTQSASQRITGRLRLLKQDSSLFMTWIPYSQRDSLKERTFVATPKRNGVPIERTSDRDRNLYTIRAVPLAEIRSIRRHTPPLGWQYMIIVLTSGLAFPPLYFHNGGIKEFLATLKEYVHIVRSTEDANLFIVNDISQDPLQRSLSSLELRDVVPVTSATLDNKEQTIIVKSLDNKDAMTAVIETKDVRRSEEDNGDECCRGRSRDPARDISINVLEKFSLVTKFARETTAQLFGESRLLGSMEVLEEPCDVYGPKKKQEEMSSLALQHAQYLATSNVFDAAKDSMQVPSPAASSLCFGVSESSCPLPTDTPTLIWGRTRLPQLGREEWVTFLENEGRVVDSKALRKRIFYGGIKHGLRREVWKFLLGYYKFDSTDKEREDLVSKKMQEYKVLKAQWQTVSEDQAKRFAKFRERKSRIEKDVVRTDRGLPFFAGDDNPNVTILRDILLTYSFYNFDLGYCQGMSDLLSPILFVMEDESESFWCFTALMERLAPNFHRDQNGMHSQILALSKLVQLLDVPLHNYLKQSDCLNYFFCFRWILIQFKREFEYENVMQLWEVLWTHYLSEHMHLYMCVALLKRYRKKIVDEQMDFDTLLKFINELSGHIDLDTTLRDAEALCIIAGDLGNACIPPGTPPSLPIPEVNGP